MDNIKYDSYSKCNCGAITLYKGNDAYSMRPATKKKLGIDLRGVPLMAKTYICDHCVNHYGIDLCSCGSGKKVGKCDCGSNTAMQTIGESTNMFHNIVKNFS